MFEAMNEALKATYKALEPSDGDQLQHIISDDEFCKMNKVRFTTEEDVLPEDVMFWPDGARTRNHELDDELYAGT